MPPNDFCENRIDRLEEAIRKLTDISADMNKMVAIQDLRLNQQEKVLTTLEDVIERRRDDVDNRFNQRRAEVDTKFKEAIDMFKEDIYQLREDISKSHENYNKQIHSLEKLMWIYMGGFSVVAFFLSHGSDVMHLLQKM